MIWISIKYYGLLFSLLILLSRRYIWFTGYAYIYELQVSSIVIYLPHSYMSSSLLVSNLLYHTVYTHTLPMWQYIKVHTSSEAQISWGSIYQKDTLVNHLLEGRLWLLTYISKISNLIFVYNFIYIMIHFELLIILSITYNNMYIYKWWVHW